MQKTPARPARHARAAIVLTMALLASAFALPGLADHGTIDAIIAVPGDDETHHRGVPIYFTHASEKVRGNHCQSLDPHQGIRHVWDFGDGTTAEGDEWTHTYTEIGTYTVTLLSYAPDTECEGSDAITLHIVNQPPVAVLDGLALVEAAFPFLVSGADSYDPDGTVEEYVYTLDGEHLATQAESDLELTLAAPGSYLIGLVVVDNDGASSEEATLLVEAVDTTPPALSLPADIEIAAVSEHGAIVHYAVAAVDLVDGEVPVACSVLSGEVFPIGTTTVECSATDAAGNTGVGTFEVTVYVALTVDVDPDGATYSPLVLLDGVSGTVAVTHEGGEPATGAEVVVMVVGGWFASPTVIEGTTGEDGLIHFDVDLLDHLPGTYSILASVDWLGHTAGGAGSYTIGLSG